MTQNDKIGNSSLLAEYHLQLEGKLRGKIGPFLYRGQRRPEAVWPLRSGAAQRVCKMLEIDANAPAYREEFIKYHKRLIETIKRKRWHSASDKDELSDLEILAKLQHGGAATCLLDFTTRFDTALWFACQHAGEKEEDTNEDGVVFVVGISHYSPMPRAISAEDIEEKKSIREILTSPLSENENSPARFFHWDPEVLMGRMLSQNSQFLFGFEDIPSGGFLVSIIIDGSHKKDLLKELERHQGLRPESVFADMQGFADANARDVPLLRENTGDYLQSSNVKIAEGDLEGGIAALDEAVGLNPELAETWHNRGFAKSKKGDLDGAIADYDEAIRREKKDAVIWNNRGFAKRLKGDFDGAIADYNEAIRLQPGHAGVWNNRGYTKNGKGEFNDAIADFDEAIRLQPEHAGTWNNRGFAKSKNRDLEGAIIDFDKAIRLNPDFAEAWNNRGFAKSKQGNIDDAIADYDKAIRLRPKNAEYWNNRGYAKNSKGEFDDAIADLSEAISLQPDRAGAWNNRGYAKSKKEEYSAAISDLSKAIRLQPEHAGAWNSRGFAKSKKSDLDGAIADYNEAIRLNPNHATAWNNRGFAKYLKSDYAGAIADFDKAIDLRQDYEEAINNRSMTLQKQQEAATRPPQPSRE